jgi:hypothetical protein
MQQPKNSLYLRISKTEWSTSNFCSWAATKASKTPVLRTAWQLRSFDIAIWIMKDVRQAVDLLVLTEGWCWWWLVSMDLQQKFERENRYATLN